jgi:hypothetical protein
MKRGWMLGAGLALFLLVPGTAGGLPRRAATPQAERAVRWALSQVGVREVGTSNCGPTIDRWQRRAGWRVPPCHKWCGAFVHEAWLQAGADLHSGFLDPERVLDDALAGRNGLRAIPVRQVRRGDLVIFRWGGHATRADHFGIVTRGYRLGDATVSTVDGNSGNAVKRGRRSLAFAVTGVRVSA